MGDYPDGMSGIPAAPWNQCDPVWSDEDLETARELATAKALLQQVKHHLELAHEAGVLAADSEIFYAMNSIDDALEGVKCSVEELEAKVSER